MPFNLLLLPLLAGYLVLARSNIRAYSTLRLSKEQLLLHASLVGLVLLGVSRLFCALARNTWIGAAVGEFIYTIAPFPYIGTALSTLLLAGLIIVVSNLLVDEDLAAKWLYHHGDYDLFTEVLWCGLQGVRQRPVVGPTRFVMAVARNMVKELRRVPLFQLFQLRKLIVLLRQLRSLEPRFDDGEAAESARMPVMLHMRDAKVIVGYVVQIKATSSMPDYVTIAPIWTGYREPASNQVVKTVDYTPAFAKATETSVLSRVLRTADIAWATLFDAAAFQFPSAPTQLVANAEGVPPAA